MKTRAVIEIETAQPLVDTAAAIAAALGGIQFEQELTGLYEEYPAYVARQGSQEYVLLGPPSPEDDLRDNPTGGFQLNMRDEREPRAGWADQTVNALNLDGSMKCRLLD
ncbi:MAG: hypothetical protein ABI036_07245 [Fibrobacteria bacterium]